jgi:Ycf1
MNNNYISLLFLGIYSGFLATIPIGPSKILSIRNFLINTKGSENELMKLDVAKSSFIAAISGLIVAQIFLVLSIYSPALLSLWYRPHFFSLIWLPVLFYFWNKIKVLEVDTYTNERLESSKLYNVHVQTAFLETFFLQLLNPIIFPHAVFSRLQGVFLFRYNTIFTFILGIFTGLLSGYVIFYLFTTFLLKRLESDTPIIYRLVKRVIHQVFAPIFFAICLISLARSPIPSIKDFNKESWKAKTWPDVFFSHDTWTRPMRLLKNNQANMTEENMRAFNKMFFSQYFFEIWKQNGNEDLYSNFPQSLSIMYREFDNILSKTETSNHPDIQIFDKWIQNQTNRKIQLTNDINTRLLALNKGLFVEEILEKKLGSINYTGNFVNKKYDPRLNTNIQSKELEFSNQSPLLINSQYFLDKIPFSNTEKKNCFKKKTSNRLKLFFAKNYKILKDLPIILWEPLLREKGIQIKEGDLYQLNIQTINDKDDWSINRLETTTNKNGQSWNNILYKIQNILQQKQEIESQKYPLSNENTIHIVNPQNILQLYKKLPLWNAKINRADLQTPESNEMRSIVVNFVRNLLPGAIRARRRKSLAWNIYQNRPHAPIFLHAINSLKITERIIEHPDNKLVLRRNTKNEIQNTTNILKSRWNFPIAHFFRGIALCSQAYIRKYIKIPLFILVKNISRKLLLLPTEWQEDWADLSQEIYVDCDYDGNDLYVGVKFPNISEFQGKQVKILRPFPFKYSKRVPTTIHFKENKLLSKKSYDPIKNDSNYMLDNYSYLTIWGYETNEPFGIQKPSLYFWKLIAKRINLIVQYKFYNKIARFSQNFHWIRMSFQGIPKKLSDLYTSIFILLNNNEKEFSSSKEVIDKEAVQKRTLLDKERITTYNKKTHTHLLSSSQDTTTKRNLNIQDSIQSGRKIDKSDLISQRSHKEIKVNQFKKNFLNEKQYNTNRIHYKKDLIDKTYKSRENTLQHYNIYIQKQIFQLKRLIYQKQKGLVFNIRHYKKDINRYFLRKTGQTIVSMYKLKFNVEKIIINAKEILSQLCNLLIFEIKNIGISRNKDVVRNLEINTMYEGLDNIHLSHAHILHALSQENFITRNNLVSVIKNWDKNKVIKNKSQQVLNTKNDFSNLENFKYIDFQFLLSQSDGYTPSFKVWRHIIPQTWSSSVKEYWRQHTEILVKPSVNQKLNLLDKNNASNHISYHTPLFENAEKFSKISTLNNIIKKYTEFCDEDAFINAYKNQELTVLDMNKLKLQVSPHSIKKIHKIQNDLRVDSNNALAKNEITARSFKFTPVQKRSSNKLPIIEQEITRLNENINIHSLKDRISYPPTRENKWKFSELKNRLRNLMKVAKQRKVLKESLLDKKYDIEIPYGMRKHLNIFSKPFEPENFLFINVLENWRYKVLDDEILMYNMLSSFLRFIKRQENRWISDLPKTSKDQIVRKDFAETYDLLPETLLLPKNIREFRILEKLNFHKNTKQSQKISIPNIYNNKSAYGLGLDLEKTKTEVSLKHNPSMYKETTNIMRFLWPAHRLEDLAYINRFWLATSNQSRFSLLRIQTFPMDL